MTDDRWKSEQEYLARSRREGAVLIGVIAIGAAVFVGAFIVSIHFIVKFW
jgi:hypothetical protein